VTPAPKRRSAHEPIAPGEDSSAALLREGRMRLHVSYCTTARNCLTEQAPGMAIVTLPPPLLVGPAYGMAVIRGARPGAEDLALFILGEEGQSILQRRGCTPLTVP
jgi:hypothetical protein